MNYLAAGPRATSKTALSRLWPLDQIEADTQYYVRDAVIDYIKDQTGPISPAIEGRLVFQAAAQPWLQPSPKQSGAWNGFNRNRPPSRRMCRMRMRRTSI